MSTTLKKIIATATVAATLGVGAVATTGVTAGASTSATPPAAASAAPAKGAGKVGKGLRRRIRRQAIKVSASTIGIPPKDLVAQLKAGTSVAEVATAHGVAPQKVVDALVTAGNKAVDQAVDHHRITAEQGAKIKARLPKLATRLVNAHRKAH